MVAAPVPPECPAQISRCAQSVVPGDGAGSGWLPRLGIFAWRDDRSRTTIGDGVMAFARVVGAIRSHAANLLIAWDLVEQMGQHRRISGVAARDLDCPDFQRLFINSNVDLAPDAPLGAAVLARVPFAFTLDLDPCAVDKQVQRALRASIWNVDRKCLLPSADGAEIRHIPIESRQPQEASHKASRLAKRHPEQDFHREARLDRGVAERLRSAPLAGRFGMPIHLGVEPDRQ